MNVFCFFIGIPSLRLCLDESRVVIPRLDQTFVLHPTAGPRVAKTAERPWLDPAGAAALTEGRDWHNDYASFALDLQRTLRATADDRARKVLLRRLRRALGTEG